MKLTCVIQVYKSMFPIKIINSVNIFYMGFHKSFPIHYRLWGEFLKHILSNLYSTIYNEVNICHTDVQKHLSYTGSHKRFLIYYELCLETAGNVFSTVFYGLFLILSCDPLC